jgi:excisionase family DNA binding protein
MPIVVTRWRVLNSSNARQTFPELFRGTIGSRLAWDNSPLLTLDQAASYIQATRRYLERQIRLGRLRALKPSGKLVRIRRADLEKFLESGMTIGGGE